MEKKAREVNWQQFGLKIKQHFLFIDGLTQKQIPKTTP